MGEGKKTKNKSARSFAAALRHSATICTHRVDAALLHDAYDIVGHPDDERRRVRGRSEAHRHLLAVCGSEDGCGRVRGRRRREAQQRNGAAVVRRELGGEHARGRHEIVREAASFIYDRSEAAPKQRMDQQRKMGRNSGNPNTEYGV